MNQSLSNIRSLDDIDVRSEEVAMIPALTSTGHVKIPVCPHCGSDNVAADAAARWSMAMQAWEVSNVFDKGHGCGDCGAEIEFAWVIKEKAKERMEREDEVSTGHPQNIGGPARNPTVTSRETATILAALRYWQREGLMNGGHEQDIASDGGRVNALSVMEIDNLCEKLNCGNDERS